MAEHDSWQLSIDAAAAYERDFVPAIFAQWPPLVADAAAIAAGDHVLDIGCGTGVLAREAAARVGPSGRVTGLDLNPAMLEIARRLRPEVDWQLGDAARLPFADAAFDAVVSQFALMFFPEPAVALAEMWRVLAPGGRLAVAVCAPLAGAEGYRRLAAILRREAGEPAAAMVERYFAAGEEAGLRRLATTAGLAGAAVAMRRGWGRFASVDEMARIEIKGSPLAALVDPAAFERVVAAARDALADFCDAERRLAMPLDGAILSARKPT